MEPAGFRPARKVREFEALQIRSRPGVDAGPVGRDRREDALAVQPRETVEDRPIEQRGAEAGDQRVQSAFGAGGKQGRLDGRMQGEGGGRRADPAIEPCRQGNGVAQLVEVLLVAERRVLVEPFRRQQLRGHPRGLAAVGVAQDRADEQLRRPSQGDDAEPERQAQDDVALAGLDMAHAQPRRAHASASRMPRR